MKFWIDCISSVPFDILGGPDYLSLLGLLKIFRLSRISALIDKSNIMKESKLVRNSL